MIFIDYPHYSISQEFVRIVNNLLNTKYEVSDFICVNPSDRNKVFNLDNKYAIKFPFRTDRYLQEKNALQKLMNGKYYPTLYSFDDQVPLLIMEWINGISIPEYVQQHKSFPPKFLDAYFDYHLDLINFGYHDCDFKLQEMFYIPDGSYKKVDYDVLDNSAGLLEMYKRELQEIYPKLKANDDVAWKSFMSKMAFIEYKTFWEKYRSEL